MTVTSPKMIKNEAPTSANIDIKCGAKGQAVNGMAKLSFQGYSGSAVDLSDYGFDAPVVYNISNMSTKGKIPILYNHGQAIGHTTSVRKVDNQSAVRGKGVASLPGENTDRVVKGIENGFPFEASMGLRGSYEHIDYVSNGTVTVNNQVFSAPIYVWNKTKLIEMTVTEFGRDSNTSFSVLNRDQLMRIKNQKPQAGETPPADTTPGEGGAAPKVDNGGTPPKVDNGKKEDTTAPATGTLPVQNGAHADNGYDENMLRALTLMNKHQEYAEDVIDGLRKGWDDERIENSIMLKRMNNGLPPAPGKKPTTQDVIDNSLMARVCLSFGSSPEFLEKKFDKKVVENAYNKSQIGITEVLLHVANSQGGSFTGHSDVEDMCHYIRNTGFSMIDLPDFFKKVGETIKEERWELNAPVAPSMCKEGSNKDFRINEKARVEGGEMWKQVLEDGKIDLFSMKGQKKYQTSLETYGSLFTLTRENVINDDQGALNDMMDAMVEGAMVIPDYQWGQLALSQAAAASPAFWQNTVNSFGGQALTRTNLSTAFKAIRKYTENRNDGINWTVMINSRWTLLVGPDLEEEAWDILKQDRIVSNTTANTIQGEKNYFFGRMDLKVFPQMGNTAAFGATAATNFATDTTWLLLPSNVRFAPYEITYLRGRKTPTIESVDLPATLLGFGTRGYWDVKVNERENTAISRHKSAAAT